MAHAMHCTMNHDVWVRMRDLASQSLLSSVLDLHLCGTVSEEKSISILIVVLSDQWSSLGSPKWLAMSPKRICRKLARNDLWLCT